MFAGTGITWECFQTQETEKAEFPQLTCQPKPNMATQPPRDHYVCGTDNRDSLPKSLKEMWKQVKKFYRVEEYYIGSTNLRINE